MHPFQKSRIVLLEELQELVSKTLTHDHEFLTQDIRRYNRKLKAIRNTIKEWLKQLVTEEKIQKEAEKLLKKENHEELLKQSAAAMAVPANASQ